MILLAKIAVGMGAVVALTGAWVCHEGFIRIDVDEAGANGSHVHLIAPATMVSVGLRVVPRHYLRDAAVQAHECLPVLREVSKELEKYPNADLVEVRDAKEHVHIGMRNGRLFVDAVTPTEDVHVTFPASTLRDVADRLEDAAPSI